MNQNDISQILPSPQQNINPFIQINQIKSQKQVFQSKIFQKIFYKKRNMKDLLEERTTLCLQLGLTSSKKSSSNPINRENIANHFCSLFSDGPSLLNQISWTIVQDRGTVYGFLATQQKYVPHCKYCNFTVYVSMRGKSGRIICSNSKCKIKLLSQFEIELSSIPKKNSKQIQNQSSKLVFQEQVRQQQKIETNLNEKQLIKRAAKRIVQ